MGFGQNQCKFEMGQHHDINVIWVVFPNGATLRNELEKMTDITK